MFFETRENQIVTQIQTGTTDAGYVIDAMPEDQAHFKDIVNKTNISVCYQNSKFDLPNSTQYVMQNENEHYGILIRSMSRKGIRGIYEAVELVRQTLHGFILPGCIHGFFFGEFSLVQKEAGKEWQYQLVVWTRSQIVQPDRDPIVPIATNVTYNQTVLP